MSDEQASKRERQKARRATRLEAERKAAASQRRNRLTAYVVLVAVAVGAVGFLIFRQVASRQQDSDQREQVAARLDEWGCTEDARMQDLGGGHINTDPTVLAGETPDTIYPDQPPTSGRHIGQVAPTGVYDVAIDPRLLTHNLEHGYINVLYAAEAPEEQVTALKQWAEEQLDGARPKMIVAQWYGDSLPEGANFAYTAWFQRQVCDEFEPLVAEVFATAHYGTDGEAPERTQQGTHVAGGQGVVSIPEDEPFLLPPLGNSLFEDLEGGASPEETAPDPGATGDATPAGGATAAATGAAPTPGATASPADAEAAPALEPETAPPG